MSLAYCKQVGHWRVSKEVIGTGTTSTVHLASYSTFPILRAAVKIVSRRSLLLKAEGDPTALHLADAVIHREVLLMKLSAHERIIKLYDFVRQDDLVYMILEYAPNKTLFDLFRSHSSFLPTSLVTHLFSHLMQALEHLHSLHIVHRDIKLENVFLFGPDLKDVLQPDSTQARNHKYKHLLQNAKHTPAHTRNTSSPSYTDLTLKLGDFGLSHTHSPNTLSTVFHGSPHYQAPELWARVPHHVFPTDVWSAGVVLFALVGRRLPFGVHELQQWGNVFNEDNCDELHVESKDAHPHEKNTENERTGPPIPRAGSPSHMPYDVLDIIPPAIDHLLQRLFALDPAMRPTAREVLADVLFFSGIECTSSRRGRAHVLHPAPSQHVHADTTDLHDLYDLATLCTPPTTHVPRATFRKSSLERRVRRRLESGEVCIEKVWAGRLKGWTAWEGEERIGTDENEKIVLRKEKEKERGKGVEKEGRVEWGEKKGWGRSLGRIRGADIRGHLVSLGHLGRVAQGKAEKAVAQPKHGGPGETKVSVLKPKVGASLSFRSLRIKTLHYPFEGKHSQPAAHVLSPLASAILSHNDATSTIEVPPSFIKPKPPFRTLRIKTSGPGNNHPAAQNLPSLSQISTRSTLQSPVASTLAFRHDAATIRSRHEAVSALQSRRDALLRRAYELGFGTQELRVFADEAGRIVQDAKEGTKGDGDDKVHSGEREVITSTDGSSSTATTLVPENRKGEQKSIVCANLPVVKVVTVEVGRRETQRGLNVDVDVIFDVDFETDLRWM